MRSLGAAVPPEARRRRDASRWREVGRARVGEGGAGGGGEAEGARAAARGPGARPASRRCGGRAGGPEPAPVPVSRWTARGRRGGVAGDTRASAGSEGALRALRRGGRLGLRGAAPDPGPHTPAGADPEA